MADLKELHKKWASAKKDAKLAWDMLDKQTADYTTAHTEVKLAVIRFPKFDKDLGPSLDKLFDLEKKRKDVKEKDMATFKKDVKKYKETADKAITQYQNDIKALGSSRGNVKTPAVKTDNSNKAAVEHFTKVLKLVDVELKDLSDTLGEIDKAVKAVKD